jgi:hypothetical protein
LRCRSCIGHLGFATTAEFAEWPKQFDDESAPDDGADEDDDDPYLALRDELEAEDIERAIHERY